MTTALYQVMLFFGIGSLALAGWSALLQHKHKQLKEDNDRLDEELRRHKDHTSDLIKALFKRQDELREAIFKERIEIAERYAKKSELADSMTKVYADLEYLRKAIDKLSEQVGKLGPRG